MSFSVKQANMIAMLQNKEGGFFFDLDEGKLIIRQFEHPETPNGLFKIVGKL